MKKIYVQCKDIKLFGFSLYNIYSGKNSANFEILSEISEHNISKFFAKSFLLYINPINSTLKLRFHSDSSIHHFVKSVFRFISFRARINAKLMKSDFPRFHGDFTKNSQFSTQEIIKLGLVSCLHIS